jgi:ABC-type phosphate transport system substrate-binding protein
MKRMLALAALLGGVVTSSAQADTVLVANPGLGISSLPKSQVTRLFLGQTDALPNGGKVTPLNVGGDSQDQFARQVLNKSPEQVEKYWARMVFTGKARPPREIRASDVKSVVASTPGAISYMDRAQVDGSVKVISVTAD